EDHLSKTAQGAGLGLAIVRALMEMQAGVFAIASEPGAGTLAALSFPKREGAAAAVPSALPRSARILVAPPARRLSSVA
ncbi:MAG: ATP-binding protein, partial [Pseudomonadota bacterium]